MNDKDNYHRLTKNRVKRLNIPITTTMPTPTVSDYSNGYIVRYFAQKSNDMGSPIYEVSQTEYSKLSSSPLYTITNLRWRISGSIVPTKNQQTGINDMGVKKSNENSIRLASDQMTTLYLHLPNLLQFYK